MSKIYLASLTYNCKGHSKSYIDTLFKSIKNDFDISPYVYGDPDKEDFIFSGSNPEKMDYSKYGGKYFKIIKRFIYSIQYFYKLKKILKKDDVIYFLDYEYLSLLFCIFLFFRKNKKLILIHSSTINGSGLYTLYKKSFFTFIKIAGFNKLEFVVNGVTAQKELSSQQGPDSLVHTVQYSEDISISEFDSKLDSKNLFRLDGKIVFSTIGMIRKDKNVPEIIRQFSKSKYANNESFVLLIAGGLSDVSLNDLHDTIKSCGINNVQLQIGYFSDEDFKHLFLATDYMILAHGQNNSSQSGPLSICRNFDIPAIVAGNGELASYVQRNNVGLVAERIDTIYKKIDVIHDSALENSFDFEQCRTKYGLSAMKNRYIKIFRNIK